MRRRIFGGGSADGHGVGRRSWRTCVVPWPQTSVVWPYKFLEVDPNFPIMPQGDAVGRWSAERCGFARQCLGVSTARTRSKRTTHAQRIRSAPPVLQFSATAVTFKLGRSDQERSIRMLIAADCTRRMSIASPARPAAPQR